MLPRMVMRRWRGSVAVEEERLIESSVLLVLIAQVEWGRLKGEHVGQRRTGVMRREENVGQRHAREGRGERERRKGGRKEADD